ncbi:hypothetical protein, partial [Aeromonas sp. QDB07]|uniref:hypothetical protein n=1 Tax=Aeromonas sp. QDB07 TaxID=2989838 RepID=UPI0022E6ED7C
LHAETALGTGRMTSTFECSKKWGDYQASLKGDLFLTIRSWLQSPQKWVLALQMPKMRSIVEH